MSSNINAIYSTEKNIGGAKPSPLYELILPKISPGSFFLDLGCGEGRDSIFMALKGFKVVSVDESSTSIHHLKKFAKENKLNIECCNQKIEDFNIEKNKYSVIGAINSLHFLSKKDGLKVINSIKQNLKKEGYLVLVNFTVEDEFFLQKPDGCFFEKGELKNIFHKFKPIFYKESIEDDPGHSGKENPHKHGIVRLIARKI